MESKKERKQQKMTKKKSDPRFSSASYDPKFIQPSKDVGKVKIDKRFSKMMTDPEFQINTTVDKYGRNTKKQKQNTNRNKQLEQYYYMDQIQHNQQQLHNQQQDDNQEQYGQQQLSNPQQNKNNRLSKWMEAYNQVSSDQDDFDENQLLEQSQGIWSDDQQNVIRGENVQVTKRLALCNYDWMNINAKDLMLLFNSFKPSTGSIKNVKIYYSQFGKQKLQQQQQHGPSGIWNQQEQQINEDQENKAFKKKTWKQLLVGSKQVQATAFNEIKLRKYQVQRLKYCYAVIQCDSKKTADQIYKECDGNQFQNSNLLFDLRYIPDSLQLPASLKKQQCNDLPVSGQVKNFISRAVGHSKIDLTWQDPELSKLAGLKNKNWSKMTEQDLQKIDWGAYLNEKQADGDQNYAKLMKKGNQQDDQEIEMDQWRKQCNKGYRRNKKQDDIEITFQSGFGGFQKTQSKPKEGQSLNHQLKTRKQRWRKNKQAKISKRRQQDGSYTKDFSFQNSQRNRQKLTLLVNEENTSKKQSFQYNPSDQRFSAVFQNPMYSIDATNPKFDHRKTGQVFKEVVKRNKNKGNN